MELVNTELKCFISKFSSVFVLIDKMGILDKESRNKIVEYGTKRNCKSTYF